MTDTAPFFSVIIPLIKIGPYITEENLPAFSKQKYKHFEVILLPNKKTDADETLLKKYSFLRIIETNDVSRPAQKRDIGASHAQGSVLAFIDDDAYPATNWLKNGAILFKKNYAAFCGPGIVPKHGQFWEQVFQTVLASSLGSGGYTYRFQPEKTQFVDDYPSMNFLIQRKTFEAVGGFNSNFWPGEDSKLCEDIVYKLNEKIQYDPSIVVFHHRRPNLGHFLKQHGNYGYHRGAFFAHGDRNSRRLSYLIPAFFVLYLAYLLISSASNASCLMLHVSCQLIVAPLIIYGLLLMWQFFTAFNQIRSLKIVLTSSIVLFLMHMYYGLKFMHGLIIGSIKKEKIYG